MDYFTNTIEIGAIEDLAEGVYMESGAFDSNENWESDHECWEDWKCIWTGHNTGHHSVCHVSAIHTGTHTGGAKPLVINFTTDFPIKEVRDASGYPITHVTDRSFTITVMNNGNPNESIGFTFQIVVDYIALHLTNEAGHPLQGAIGTKNANDYSVKVASYRFG